MDFNRALAEISALRGQMARTTEFRGYGPAAIASTGLVGLAAAAWQALTVPDPAHDIGAYLTVWVVTAAVAVVAIGLETVPRTRRMHPALAREMILSAVMHFVPPVAAGMLLTVVVLRSAPASVWMLPGLWQLMFSLGVFSSSRLLPRPVIAVGIWYAACGLVILSTADPGFTLSGPAMGVPFGIGQLLVAAILHRGYQQADEAEESQT